MSDHVSASLRPHIRPPSRSVHWRIDTMYPSASSRPVTAAALAIPDLAALIFSACCSGIRVDLQPPAWVIAARLFSVRPGRSGSCPRPTTAGPEARLRAASRTSVRCHFLWQAPHSTSILDFGSPCIFNASKSCVAPTRVECPLTLPTIRSGISIHWATRLKIGAMLPGFNGPPTWVCPMSRRNTAPLRNLCMLQPRLQPIHGLA
jgi:hypothetical protein